MLLLAVTLARSTVKQGLYCFWAAIWSERFAFGCCQAKERSEKFRACYDMLLFGE
jgi:hypothetical protein